MSTQPYRRALVEALPSSPEHAAATVITYWLEHKGHCVTAIRAPRGLPDQTVRFLAANQHDRVPLHALPLENAQDRRRRILASQVFAEDLPQGMLFGPNPAGAIS